MEKYFWIANEEFSHVVENVEPAENPCGNDSQHYVAYCGARGNSWTMRAMSGRIAVDEEEMKKLKKPICPICQEIRNIKTEISLKYGREKS